MAFRDVIHPGEGADNPYTVYHNMVIVGKHLVARSDGLTETKGNGQQEKNGGEELYQRFSCGA